MKRFFSLLLVFAIVLFASVGLAENIITIDLDTVTDEELEAAIELLLAEKRARIVTKVSLSDEELTIGKGKTAKLTAEVIDLPEDLTASKFTWSTSDNKIATVTTTGSVSAKAAGKAVIRCSTTLSDGTEIYADCDLEVIVAVNGLTAATAETIKLSVGDKYDTAVKVRPNDATNPKLTYSSSDKKVATVDKNGIVTAVAPGDCKITATTVDGSEKSVTYKIKVLSLGASQTKVDLTNKKGETYIVHYYGDSPQNVKFDSSSSYNASVSMSYDKAAVNDKGITYDFKVNVTPLAAGSITVTVSDKDDTASKVKLSINISHDAVYDTTSYPAINYNDASRYPESYNGKCVSFSGKVLQVIDGWGTTEYRISSKGNWDNVVYVTIDNDDITTPIIEDDKVTVYGTYDGNYSYTAVLGNKITLPCVNAERINLK